MCADDVRGTQEPVTRMRRCQIARIDERMTRPHRRRRVRGFAPSWIIYAYTSSGLASSQRIVCSIFFGSLRISQLREFCGWRRSNQRLQRAWIYSGPGEAGASVGPSNSPRERAEVCPINAGDHPRVTHRSCVAYHEARMTTLERLIALARFGPRWAWRRFHQVAQSLGLFQVAASRAQACAAKGTFLIAVVNCTMQANRLFADQASCHNK